MTKAQLENYELTHRFSGNGWAMVQDLDDAYCRVTDAVETKAGGRQAFLARKDMLSVFRLKKDHKDPMSEYVDVPLKKEVRERMDEIRGDLASGALKVEGSWIKSV